MSLQPTLRSDERLFDLLKQHGHCDLLIDCTLNDPLGVEVANETLQSPAAPVNPPLIEVEPDECPRLLRLGSNNLALLDASVALAKRHANPGAKESRPVCGWLFGAEVSTEALARHLERQIIVSGENSKKFALRFFDPRVMSWLLAILDPAQMSQLLGPVALWVWMGRSGDLRSVARPAMPSLGASSAAISISVEQDAAIDRIELLNQALSALAGLGNDWPEQEDALLDAWLLQAQDKGHAERADQLAYVLHAALVHPSFDRHPAVASAIAQARKNRQGLCSALEKFDDAFWSAVRTQLATGVA